MRIQEHHYIDFIISSDGISCLFDNKITGDQKVLLLLMFRKWTNLPIDTSRVLEVDDSLYWLHIGEIACQVSMTAAQTEQAFDGMIELGVITHEIDDEGYHIINLSDSALRAMREYRDRQISVDTNRFILRRICTFHREIFSKARETVEEEDLPNLMGNFFDPKPSPFPIEPISKLKIANHEDVVKDS